MPSASPPRTHERLPGDIHLAFQEDGRTPASATFSVAGLAGKVRFHGWQTDTVAPEALFEPPAGLKRVEVEQADVCRIFAALLNFGAEYIEPGRERPDVHQTAMTRHGPRSGRTRIALPLQGK